jgi:hypothetical protein
MTRRSPLSDTLTALRVPFPASQVKQNQNKLDYVPIDGYINRFLDTCGLDYNFIVTQSNIELLADDENLKTSTGKRQYLAQVTGQITVFDRANGTSTVRSGTGADVSFDPDKSVKTAQAEAFKKAAHQFGVALELWDESHRADIATARKAGDGNEGALKKAVFDLAKKKLNKTKPTVAQVAECFLVSAGDLSDMNTLRGILETEGVL